MQWRTKFNTQLHNLTFTHVDEGCFYLDVTHFCALSYQLVKGVVVCRPTVWVAGTVLLHGTDQNGLCAKDLCPANSRGEKMRVAEWHIGDRHV